MNTENPTASLPPKDGLTLNFNMHREDRFALVWEYNCSSKTFRRARIRSRWLVPIVYVILWSLLCVSSVGFNWSATVIFLGTALLWFLFNPRWVNRRARRYIRKTLEEDRQAKVLGAYTLTLTPDALHSKGPIGEGTYYWTAVERLVQRDTHLFIFLAAGAGWAIPVAEVGEQAVKEAYTYATAQRQQREAGSGA